MLGRAICPEHGRLAPRTFSDGTPKDQPRGALERSGLEAVIRVIGRLLEQARQSGTYTGDPPAERLARGKSSRAELGQGGSSWSGLRRFAGCPRGGGERWVVGHRLVDDFLEFAASRARPNTVRAYAHDLKAFFTVVAKEPVDVRPADVMAFITAQRRPRGGSEKVVRISDGEAGLSAATIRRRLAAVSSFYGYLITRGDVGVERSPVPRGLPTRRSRHRKELRGQPLVREVRRLPRILDPEELAALMGALRTDRDRAMVQAMALGGAAPL